MATSDEKSLLEHFRRLNAEQQRMLLEFAVFLTARQAGADDPAVSDQAPLPVARPATETVVKAIKRLAQTYPMLDRRKLFGETSKFLAQHTLEGRPAAAVIDELEVVFLRHYEKLKKS